MKVGTKLNGQCSYKCEEMGFRSLDRFKLSHEFVWMLSKLGELLLNFCFSNLIGVKKVTNIVFVSRETSNNFWLNTNRKVFSHFPQKLVSTFINTLYVWRQCWKIDCEKKFLWQRDFDHILKHPSVEWMNIFPLKLSLL